MLILYLVAVCVWVLADARVSVIWLTFRGDKKEERFCRWCEWLSVCGVAARGKVTTIDQKSLKPMDCSYATGVALSMSVAVSWAKSGGVAITRNVLLVEGGDYAVSEMVFSRSFHSVCVIWVANNFTFENRQPD